MSIRVTFFGELADIAQRGSELDLGFCADIDRLDKLEQTLAEGDAELAQALAQKTHLRSVNHEMKATDCPLNDGDIVAFMSPFSGG